MTIASFGSHAHQISRGTVPSSLLEAISSRHQTMSSHTPEFKTPKGNSRYTCTPSTGMRRTPLNSGTPKRPSSARRTPGDRFIPNRATTDMDFARFKVNNKLVDENSPPQRVAISSEQAMLNKLLDLKGVSVSSRTMSFGNGAEKNTPGRREYWNAYTPTRRTPTKKINARKIPKNAEKILDAPNLANDFYLNVLDWSSNGYLAVALGGTVYVLHTDSGDISQLYEDPTESGYVSSLAWNKSGSFLAVGLSSTDVQLWDVNASKMVRQFKSHKSRVSTLSWNTQKGILSSGSQRGHIHNYDPRMAQLLINSLQPHTLDVCGLKWSPNGRFLASGGNDNIVNVWDMYTKDPWLSPVHTLKEHNAAVKALAWSPWQPSVLASGGGSTDKRICLWNACNGKLQETCETDSQVSGLVWSKYHRELLSTHGSPSNQLVVWSCDQATSKLSTLAKLSGHEDRILHVAVSADGESVVSAGADETLRFWNVFARDAMAKKHSPNVTSAGPLALTKYIR